MSTETKETKETKEEVKGDEESFDLEGEDVTTEDTGDHPVVLTEHFSRLLKSEKFADCTFVVGEGKSQKKFTAHRLILAAASPVLEAMLYPDPALSEKTADESSIEVKLPHTDSEAFETLLRCVYTDKVDISATNISDLINVATKYQIEKIRVACADFMERDVTHENVCELFENAPKLLGDPEFGLKFIEENTEEVLRSESFLKLSKERLEVILQDEKLSTDEGLLFDAVLKWAEHKSEILKKDKKDIAKDLVKYIRFPLMEVSKVASSVASSGLLDQDELLSVFQYVAVSDETKKADLKCVFSTKTRSGKKTVIVEWDPTQSFTNGLYTVSNKGRTARKTSGEGTIYILRAKQMLPSTGKHYWEIFVDNILRTSDIHIGACIPSFSWTSAWLKVSGSYYVDGQIGGAYDGSGARRFDFPALSNNDRIGFLVDYKKKVLEVYRGTGKHGKMTKMGEFTGITQPLYPVIASRPVGCQFTSM